MIYITGDTHGDPAVFQTGSMPGEDTWTEKDILIVCGDFGFIFDDSEEENAILDYIATKPYTVCFCDGNHECFTRLKQYPEEEWNGGLVHRVRRNIVHLMRGQVFTVDGKKMFAMGGAYSIDKYMRCEGISWWKEELPDNDEYEEAVRNLQANNMQVDFIISHTAPAEIIRRMGKIPHQKDAELTGFLEWIMYEVKFKEWFFGHWHEDRTIDGHFHALWLDVVTLREVKR